MLSAIVSTSFDFLPSGYAFTSVSIFVEYYVPLFRTKKFINTNVRGSNVSLGRFATLYFYAFRGEKNGCKVLIKNADVLIFFPLKRLSSSSSLLQYQWCTSEMQKTA